VADPQDSFYRKTAIDHYLATEENGQVIRISPPWTWAVVAVVAAVIGAALLLSIFGRIEITAHGRGILRPRGGVRVLIAEAGGVVSHVDARSGASVRRGGPVLRLQSAELQAALLEAERELELVTSDSQVYTQRQARMFDEQERSLRTRLAILEQESGSYEQSVKTYERKLDRSRELEQSGLLSPTIVEDVRETLSQARRQLSTNSRSLAQTRQELASTQSQRQEELWQRQRARQYSISKRDALAFSLQRMQIRAPVDGVVEAVLVKTGDVVQAGQIVGKLVPQETGFQVVSFLPEKDRASVHVNDVVKLELEQFPYTEYGTLKGRIQRIGDDLASTPEIREALGEETRLDTSSYRVEILVDPAGRPRGVPLRTGMLMNVRYILRRERPIALFFAPLQRWLD
jgi:membrane fusion protein